MRDRISTYDQIEKICGEFESKWSNGSISELEAYVASTSDAKMRSELFARLLALDIQLRTKSGKNVTKAEYESRFPFFRDVIRSVFSASHVMQNAGDVPTEAFVTASIDTRSEFDPYATKPDPRTVSPADTPLRIGDYLVLNKIAEHGQGIVYRANHPDLHRQVVIKVSNSMMEDNPQVLMDEARVLAQLKHPNVATVYDYKRDSGNRPYLVMEYIEGRNLADILKETKFSVTETIQLISTVCHGLQHAHDMGILHLDLKPGNIVIRAADKVPKIIDFGLAQLRPAYGVSEVSSFGGTWRYMAPEQAAIASTIGIANEDVRELDVRADVYAVGAILYEMLTDQPLRSPSNNNRESVKYNSFDANALSKPSIPRSIKEICLRALETDRAKRISSASELATLLDSVTCQSDSRRSKQLTAYAAGLLVVCLCIAFIWSRIAQSNALTSNFEIAASTSKFTEQSNDEFKRAGHIDIDSSNATSGLKPIISQPEVPLKTLLLEVTHFATENGKVRPQGVLGRQSFGALLGDEFNVQAKLSRPAFSFIIVYRSDGQDEVLYPQDDTDVPELTDSPHYPSKRRDERFVLEEGSGQWVVALFASETPLPNYKEWRLEHKGVPWTSTEGRHGTVVLDDGQLIQQMESGSSVRGSKANSDLAPIARLTDWLRAQAGGSVQAIGFTVK